MTTAPQRFTIRPAAADDVPALAAMRLAMFDDMGHAPDVARREAFLGACRSAFAAGIERGFCLAWMAVAGNGEAIGAAALLLYPKLPSPEAFGDGEGYLLNVYVVPAWRRRGVATRLVDSAIEAGRARRLARIRLHATDDGRGVYEAAGFAARSGEMGIRLTRT